MSKKSETKLIDRIGKIVLQNEEEAKAATDTFYPNDVIAPFSLSSEQNPFASLHTQVKMPPAPQTPTQEQLTELCQLIRTDVKQGKPGSIEIQFNKGRQLSDKKIFPLGNTVVKLRTMDADEPIYLFIKAGDMLDAAVFLGGDNAAGIMVIKDEKGEEHFLRLFEFHLLSLRENPDPHKELGLMTSYLYLTAKVYTSIIFATNLFPVKNLLLSEYLQKEWQRAKDSAAKSSNEIAGGNSNG